MHVAFISYPLKKQAVANSVYSSLEAAGLACWIAPAGYPAGLGLVRGDRQRARQQSG